MSVNKIILLGRLGRDPETRYTPSGVAVTDFSVATEERWTGSDGTKQSKTTWHNVVAWRKTAEVCAQYLKKGREVFIEGKIDNTTYQGKDGETKYRTQVVADHVVFVWSKQADESAPEDTGESYFNNDGLPS